MAKRKGITNQAWFKKVHSATKADIVVSAKSFRSTMKRLGITVPKGATSYTFKGNAAIRDAFSRIAGQTLVNPHAPKGDKRYIGLQGGKGGPSGYKSVTISIGKAPAPAGSGGALKSGEQINKSDYAQARNFGLRMDGTARLGYTLAQCMFSFEYRRAGERGDYDRYGSGNQSVLNRVRGKFGLPGYEPPKKSR